jgi:hypothetical protein
MDYPWDNSIIYVVDWISTNKLGDGVVCFVVHNRSKHSPAHLSCKYQLMVW